MIMSNGLNLKEYVILINFTHRFHPMIELSLLTLYLWRWILHLNNLSLNLVDTWVLALIMDYLPINKEETF
jgi:hypothetical protein